MTEQQRPLEGLRVLVVEDDYFLATDACSWLERAGARVVGPAPTVEQACGILDKDPVDRAVVDINLGQGPTFEVANRLAEKGVPFLVATGYDQSALPAELRATPRLEKPYRGQQLVEAVEALLPAPVSP